MNKLIAFQGSQEIKDKYVARIKEHAEANAIIKGTYWQDGKGCAVGCTIEGNDHTKYETELGIPTVLAYLEDGLFEEMPNKEAMKFPLRFIEAITVGADKIYWDWAWAWARARAWAWAEYEKQIMVTANKLIELLKETK